MNSHFDFLRKSGGNTGNAGNGFSKANDIRGFRRNRLLPRQGKETVITGNGGVEKVFVLPAIPIQKEAVVTVKPNARADAPSITSATTAKEADVNYLYHERAGIFQYDGELSQSEAERLAYQETLLIYMEETHPTIMDTFQNIILNNPGENT